jgi:hypothetical protein
MKKSPLLAATLVALAVVGGVARFAVAGSSFLGQGAVPFDSVKIGRKDADKIQLNGTVLNSRSGKPVLIGDGLRVTGNIDAAGLTVRGTTNMKNLSAGILSADTLYSWGDLGFTGTLFSGSTNYSSRIDTNATMTTHVTGFLNCMGQASQFTTYIESSDFITCFNSWLKGQPVSVP